MSVIIKQILFFFILCFVSFQHHHGHHSYHHHSNYIHNFDQSLTVCQQAHFRVIKNLLCDSQQQCSFQISFNFSASLDTGIETCVSTKIDSELGLSLVEDIYKFKSLQNILQYDATFQYMTTDLTASHIISGCYCVQQTVNLPGCQAYVDKCISGMVELPGVCSGSPGYVYYDYNFSPFNAIDMYRLGDEISSMKFSFEKNGVNATKTWTDLNYGTSLDLNTLTHIDGTAIIVVPRITKPFLAVSPVAEGYEMRLLDSINGISESDMDVIGWIQIINHTVTLNETVFNSRVRADSLVCSSQSGNSIITVNGLQFEDVKNNLTLLSKEWFLQYSSLVQGGPFTNYYQNSQPTNIGGVITGTWYQFDSTSSWVISSDAYMRFEYGMSVLKDSDTWTSLNSSFWFVYSNCRNELTAIQNSPGGLRIKLDWDRDLATLHLSAFYGTDYPLARIINYQQVYGVLPFICIWLQPVQIDMPAQLEGFMHTIGSKVLVGQNSGLSTGFTVTSTVIVSMNGSAIPEITSIVQEGQSLVLNVFNSGDVGQGVVYTNCSTIPDLKSVTFTAGRNVIRYHHTNGLNCFITVCGGRKSNYPVCSSKSLVIVSIHTLWGENFQSVIWYGLFDTSYLWWQRVVSYIAFISLVLIGVLLTGFILSILIFIIPFTLTPLQIGFNTISNGVRLISYMIVRIFRIIFRRDVSTTVPEVVSTTVSNLSDNLKKGVTNAVQSVSNDTIHKRRVKNLSDYNF